MLQLGPAPSPLVKTPCDSNTANESNGNNSNYQQQQHDTTHHHHATPPAASDTNDTGNSCNTSEDGTPVTNDTNGTTTTQHSCYTSTFQPSIEQSPVLSFLSVFSAVSTGALTMDSKFAGAAAVGTKVVFAPYSADVVGVFDTATGTFDASASTGGLTMGGKFNGAAAVGTKVVFAPYFADVVGFVECGCWQPEVEWAQPSLA